MFVFTLTCFDFPFTARHNSAVSHNSSVWLIVPTLYVSFELIGLGLNAILCFGLAIKKIFPIIAVSIVATKLGLAIIAPLLSLHAESLWAGGIWIGVVFASFYISRAILMPIAGKLSDRNGRKYFICLGLLLFTLTSLGYVWAGSLAQLTLVRLLQGGSAAMIIPIAQAYVGDLSPRGEEGKWMGYFNAAFFIGLGLGPVMGDVLTERFGMNLAFYSMGGISFIAFIVVLLFLPERRAKKGADSAPSVSFREMARSAVVKGLAYFQLTYAFGRGVLFTFLPILGALYVGLSPDSIGILLTTSMLVTGVTELYSGRLADRLNRRVLVAIGGGVNLAFLALIPLMGSFWPLMAVCVGSGIGGAIALPAASAMGVDEGRNLGMGSVMGILMMAMSMGMAFGPILGGLIEETEGLTFGFLAAAGAIFSGVVLFLWLTRRSQ